jgi:hypothetical protein
MSAQLTSARCAGLVLVLVALAGCGGSADGSSRALARQLTDVRVSTAGGPGLPEVRALRILRGWDRRRAHAYAEGDVVELRRLYTLASRAGAEDADNLRRYVDRGLVVDELAMQLLSVRVIESSPDRLRLRVVDRFAHGEVSSGPSTALLPPGRATTRAVTLVRRDRGWLVRSVRR